MAKPRCTFCEENEGVLMVTNLVDGDTQIVCGIDLPGFALGMAAAMTDGMTPEESEMHGAALDAIRAHDCRVAADSKAGKRSGGKRAAKSAPENACPSCGGALLPQDDGQSTCGACGNEWSPDHFALGVKLTPLPETISDTAE